MPKIKGWTKVRNQFDEIWYIADSKYDPTRETGRSMVYIEKIPGDGAYIKDSWRIDTRGGWDGAGDRSRAFRPTKEDALSYAYNYMKTHQPKK